MNNKHNYLHFCHLNNLASYLSTGFVYSDSIGSHFMQYYKSSISCDNDKIKLFHQDALPKLKDKEQMVCIAIGDIFDKNNVNIQNGQLFKMEKNEFRPIKRRLKPNTPIFLQNFVPVTAIKNIYFLNDKGKDKFFQMEYKNQISLNKNLFKIDDSLFSGENNNTFPKQETIEENSFDFYRLFNKQFAEHIVFMNSVIQNNQYTKNFDNRVPKNFDYLVDLDSNEQNDLQILNNIIKDKEFNIKTLSSNCISTCEEKEWVFALSLWKIIRENSPKLKVEEERDNYVDIKKQYGFTIEDVRAIGKIVKEYFSKTDPIIQTLILFVNTNLDIDSIKVTKQIDTLESKIVKDLFKIIYNLLRYGKRVERVRDIFIDDIDFEIPQNLLKNLIYASFIGIEKLPKRIKQPLNWKFAFDSFSNDNLPLIKAFPIKTKEKWERYKWDFTKLPPWIKVKSEKVIRYNKKPFKLLFNDISYEEKSGETIGCFPLLNKHGFVYHIKESRSIREKSEFYKEVLNFMFNKFIKQLSDSRVSDLIYDFYKNLLTKEERFFFEDYISKEQPTPTPPDG